MVPTIKTDDIIERQGKRFVLYRGLLDAAHQDGLKRIKTDLLQAPRDQNGLTAIVWAEVETSKGVFTGVGDAAPVNVNREMMNVIVRMAETRAKARALRDAVNCTHLLLEDDGDEHVQPSQLPPRPAAPAGPQTRPLASAPVASASGLDPELLTRYHAKVADVRDRTGWGPPKLPADATTALVTNWGEKLDLCGDWWIAYADCRANGVNVPENLIPNILTTKEDIKKKTAELVSLNDKYAPF